MKSQWRLLYAALVIVLILALVYVYLHSDTSHFYRGDVIDQTDSTSAEYSVFDGCPQQGDAQSEKAILLNHFKNRFTFPDESDFDTIVTLDAIMQTGDDRDRWSADHAARITGYVYDVKHGGIETCNCREKEDRDKDTHIEILLDPMHDDRILRMVVEVTPRIRDIMNRRGENWSTQSLRDRLLGRWVEIEGWMMFDDEHTDNAENTNPDNERNWRGTAWEIHPATKLTVVDRPQAEQQSN